MLRTECGLRPGHVIADMGSGRGLLSELFLRNGNRVYGIEPNKDMRAAGEGYLAEYDGFSSIDGSAETTTLSEASVDFVTAGQAFHRGPEELGGSRTSRRLCLPACRDSSRVRQPRGTFRTDGRRPGPASGGEKWGRRFRSRTGRPNGCRGRA